MSEIDIDAPEVQEAIQARLDEEVAGLKSALDKERKERRNLERKIKQWDGVDLDEYRTWEAERTKAAEEQAKAEKDFAKLEETLRETHAKDLEKLAKELKVRDDRIESLKGSLYETLIESEAKSAIAEARGDVELLLPHVRTHTDIVELDTGKRVAVVLDKDGEPRFAANAKNANDYMTIRDLVAAWREEGKFARAFDGSGASGGGATGNRSGGGAATRVLDGSDPYALGRSLDDIAEGKVKVRMD